MAKKKNPQDATLRNVRAAKKRESATTLAIKELVGVLEALTLRIERLEGWVTTHDAAGPYLRKGDI